MVKKLQLSVLCGGESTEHEISIRSAKNIVSALNMNKYDVTVIYITPQGEWLLLNSVPDFLSKGPEVLWKAGQGEPITVVLGDHVKPWQSLVHPDRHYSTECVFPVLHGTHGEDGTLQGLLDLLHVPYVSAGVQSSAMCMQKEVTKQMLRFAGIAVPDWYVIHTGDVLTGLYEKLSAQYGKELFVKPASLGSSVATIGIKDKTQFNTAVQNALRYDERVLVEPRIIGREIECAVLGNNEPKASLPGEIVVQHDYYSYEAKYIDPTGANIIIPASFPEPIIQEIQAIAIKAFTVMYCTGMARVDFFVVNDEKILVNELNTIPGFTNISMYPKMWEASGLSYTHLLDELITLALDRHRFRQSLTRIYHHRGPQ